MRGPYVTSKQSGEAIRTVLDARAWAEDELRQMNLFRERQWFDLDEGGSWTEVEAGLLPSAV
jgi:hypothetical protein